ncbi:hypothetical protein CDD81_6191 [Ophiocordyceps australis]|uniref:Uncharacterized protein n=1 Tax=Ophiocordyceps australis TaxID=1399860 RepID=A0A2C5X9M0_9HYPO|nr:hypothetical protein CDD81_6191 [Ophiocordyceps australis]
MALPTTPATGSNSCPELEILLANPVQAVQWLEAQPPQSQKPNAQSSFQRLLNEASQPKSASGQACTRLCGLVEQASVASSPQLVQWAFSTPVTLDLFTFYLEWNESDHHRSMKLVLDVTGQLLKRNPDEEGASNIKANIVDTIISTIAGRSIKPVAKSAIKALEHFVTKGILSLDDVYGRFTVCRNDSNGGHGDQVWENLTAHLFQWLKLHYVCPAAGKLIICLYLEWRQQDDEATAMPSRQAWYGWLVDFVCQQPWLLESIKNYIFLPLFKADGNEAMRLLHVIKGHETTSAAGSFEVDTATLLQLAALETGKKVGLVEEPDLKERHQESWAVRVDEKKLDSLLAHSSHQVRVLALSLLISSPSTTRPYSSTALQLLRKHLGTFFADSDAKFRVEVTSRARDMFKRVRGAIHVLKRSIPRARAKARQGGSVDKREAQPVVYRANLIMLPEAQLTSCLEYHEEFLAWYLNFLCRQLGPTASYQRHVASLKALVFILRNESRASQTWESQDDQTLFFDVFDDKWARALFDLVMDPFDDVRQLSATAIQIMYEDPRWRFFSPTRQAAKREVTQTLRELAHGAEKLAQRTSRAHHSDGASRAWQLLYRFLASEQERVSLLSKLMAGLEDKVAMAHGDLGRAVLEAPLHGDLASINHLWQTALSFKLDETEVQAMQSLQERLVSCCQQVWQAVRQVLCDDSPEGHLPDELEELEGLDTKDVLSYSFRAVHESSNLMRTLVQSMSSLPSRRTLIPPSRGVFESIGSLVFEQLASLRHRGALTTVAATFATCCQQTKHVHSDRDLLQQWYQGTLEAISSQASTTRRSAGIPSMMTAILSANASQPGFDAVMAKLMQIAGQEASVSDTDDAFVPQVHAYNCLKDIFKNSVLTSLGNRSDKYLPQCLELAANGLGSSVWAIRNCGLLFLRSLIDCLFGSHETKAMLDAGWDGKANRIPYHRYPNLAAVLARLLRWSRGEVAAESVFPALDIIRRAGPPEALRNDIELLVAAYLNSRLWHVRELAARTLCSCLLHPGWFEAIERLMEDALCRNDNNHMHGVLMTLNFVVARLQVVDADCLFARLDTLTRFLSQPLLQDRLSSSYDVMAAYLQVVNTVWALQTATRQPRSPFRVAALVKSSATGSALFRRQQAIYKVHVACQEHDEPMKQLRGLLLDAEASTHGLVAALETLPQLLAPSSLVCELYIDVCKSSVTTEARVKALDNLAPVLQALLAADKVDNGLVDALAGLWTFLRSGPLSPTLANAVVAISGRIVAAMSNNGVKRHLVDVESWGRMMSEAGADDKEFDTRLAGVESLCAFMTSAKSQASLWPLLALYDALNDDDDEMRHMACAAVNSVLGKALVPLAAADALVDWLVQRFAAETAFGHEVVRRMVGAGAGAAPWTAARHQLASALRSDDALFVVEERNLFVDAVRETNRWALAFEALDWPLANSHALQRLQEWLVDGIAYFAELVAQRHDGPLGWTSSPHVFALCTRLMRASSALQAKKVSSTALDEAVMRARGALERRDARVSRLLTDVWGL